MKDLLNNLLMLKTNRNKKRDEKENLFFAHFDDFFSNFVYYNELTKDCLFDFLKKNDVSINDATLISSSIVKIIEEKKKNIDQLILNHIIRS